jgi:hypothetical protein
MACFRTRFLLEAALRAAGFVAMGQATKEDRGGSVGGSGTSRMGRQSALERRSSIADGSGTWVLGTGMASQATADAVSLERPQGDTRAPPRS